MPNACVEGLESTIIDYREIRLMCDKFLIRSNYLMPVIPEVDGNYAFSDQNQVFDNTEINTKP